LKDTESSSIISFTGGNKEAENTGLPSEIILYFTPSDIIKGDFYPNNDRGNRRIRKLIFTCPTPFNSPLSSSSSPTTTTATIPTTTAATNVTSTNVKKGNPIDGQLSLSSPTSVVQQQTQSVPSLYQTPTLTLFDLLSKQPSSSLPSSNVVVGAGKEGKKDKKEKVEEVEKKGKEKSKTGGDGNVNIVNQSFELTLKEPTNDEMKLGFMWHNTTVPGGNKLIIDQINNTRISIPFFFDPPDPEKTVYLEGSWLTTSIVALIKGTGNEINKQVKIILKGFYGGVGKITK
jgi:hypothetical protein